MNKRLGFVGIIIEDRKQAAQEVNTVLTEYAGLFAGRMGLPHVRRQTAASTQAREDTSVIVLIVDATTDEIGALTGRLGRIPGVSVKSALGKET